MYDFSVRQLICLHLAKYSHLDPGMEFGAPMEITQDGVAAAAGITRAHACTVLLRLEKNGEVAIGLSRIKGSNCRVKRKVYFLTALGRERTERLLSDLRASGVPDSELSTPPTVSRMSSDMRRGLPPEDRDAVGMLCVLRHAAARKDLDHVPHGLMFDGKGLLVLKEEAKRRFVETGSEEDLRRWHSLAADLCIGKDDLIAERLHHLRAAGRRREASKLVLGNIRRLEEDPGSLDDLIGLCRETDDPELFPVTAAIALRAGEPEKARLALGTRDAKAHGATMSEILLAEGDSGKALDLALENYSGDAMGALALGKAMAAAGRHEEALTYLTASRRRMVDSGNLFRMDEVLEAESESNRALGRNERADALMKAAEASRRRPPDPVRKAQRTVFPLSTSRSEIYSSLISLMFHLSIASLSNPNPHARTGIFTPRGSSTSGLKIPAPPSSIHLPLKNTSSSSEGSV